jgi:hypothetical protein
MLVRLAVFLILFAVASPTFSQEESERPEPRWALQGATLVRGEEAVELPCSGTSLAREPDRLYVACESGRLLVLDATIDPPRPLGVTALVEPVRISRVYESGGEVWVETPAGSRRASEMSSGVFGPATRPPTPEPRGEPPSDPEVEPEPEPVVEPSKPASRLESEPLPIGEVVSLGVGTVVVDLGVADGLAEEEWVEFFLIEDVDLGGGEVVRQERRIGVGEVDTAGTRRAKVRLALNETIPLGAKVREEPEGVTTMETVITPRRPRGVWELAINTRPFLALGTLGGGAIFDGAFGYRFDAPAAIDLFFTPFAFGLARAGDILTFAGNVVASYDQTAFQVGLGAGVSRINTLPAGGGTDFVAGPDAEEPSFRAGFSAAQYVRLGSVDGLHVSVLNNFILFEDEFSFGGITIDAAVPIRVFADPAWIRARGGGGVPGYIFGELGIRVLAVGNGGPGSLFLTPTVGAGVLTGERWVECEGYPGTQPPVEPVNNRDGTEELQPGICRDEYDYGGPLVGFGVEYRF